MVTLIEVDDPRDPRLSDYRDLRDVELRKHLETTEGLFIAEGEKVVRRAVEAGFRPRSFLMARRWLDGLADVLGPVDVPCYVVDEELAEQVTGFHVHRGALGSLHRRPLPPVAEVLDDAQTVVVLEDVVDHTNVGAIFRSAAALGVDAVLLSPRCADPLYRRSVKVAMGAVFSVPYARTDGWYDAVRLPLRRRVHHRGLVPGRRRRAGRGGVRREVEGRPADGHRGTRALAALGRVRRRAGGDPDGWRCRLAQRRGRDRRRLLHCPGSEPRVSPAGTRPAPRPGPSGERTPPVTHDHEAARRSRHQVIGDGLAWTATWSLRWIFIAAGAVLLGLVVRETWPILLPVLLALIVTSVFQPAALLLQRNLRFPTTLAAAAVMLGGLAVLFAVGFAITQSVAGQADDIAADATSGLQKIQDWVQSSNMVTEDQLDAAIQGLQDRITDSASGIASGVVVGVGAVGSAVITLVVTLILTFLFLKDGQKFLPWVGDLAGERVGPHLREVLGQSWDSLGGFIRTQALVSFIDAVLIGIGLLIVGVPLAVPLAILTFFGGFVPIVGAIVVGALAVLVALVSVSVTGALVVLAIIVGVQQLEGNVLQPWLQSKSVQLNAAVVLLSITLGSTLFGIVGAFLAVPFAAVAAVVLRYLNQQVTRVSTPHSEASPASGAEPEPGTDEGPENDAVEAPANEK